MNPVHVVSFADERMSPVAALTFPYMAQYAARHGYTFHGIQGNFAVGRHPSWNKILAVINLVLSETGEWVLWLDADVLIMDERFPALEIGSRVPNNVQAVFGTDDNGLCAGTFLIRRNLWSLEFLRAVYHLGDVRDEYLYGDGPRMEQNCIKAIRNCFAGYDQKIVCVEQNVMNAYPHTYVPGSWLLHFSSFSIAERISLIERFSRERKV